MVKKVSKLLIFFLFYHFCTFPKVLIYTYAFNRPDFIEIQHKTFKKFLKDEYEFIIFNDANNQIVCNQIEQVCAKCGLDCIRIPQEIHNRPYLRRLPGENYQSGAVRNCNVVMYSLREYGFKHDDILVLFDSDMFLIKDLSIRDALKGYDLMSAPVGEVRSSKGIGHMWHGFCFMDFKTMPNKETLDFNCGKIDGIPVDAGGYSILYLRNNPEVRIKWLDGMHSANIQMDEQWLKERFNEHTINFIKAGMNYLNPLSIDFNFEYHFLHYRSGTNWDSKSNAYHSKKTELFNDYIASILAEKS